MESFFKFFPSASIVVANFDWYQKKGVQVHCIAKRWSDFTVKELRDWNLNKKYGIYFVPCDMKSPEHKAENHDGIRAWYCDIDVSTKKEQLPQEEIEERKSKILERLMTEGYDILKPSFVVDTRNGFHIYWLAWHEEKLDDHYAPVGGFYKPSMENFDKIERTIVKKTEGDDKAKKGVQLMRLPGFYNWKKDEGYPCRVIPEFNFLETTYCESDWSKYLISEPTEHEKAVMECILTATPRSRENDIFDACDSMDQVKALKILSGKPEVNGDVYTFVESMRGKHLNIICNGNMSPCFVDLEKNRIFVPSGTTGSPNIIEWLKYYNHEYKTKPKLLAETLHKYFNR